MSFATAYSGLALLAAALSVGPLNVLRRRPNPASSDLRRDIGIWAGVFAIAHTIAGFQVHMHGDLIRYFTARGADLGTKAFVAANFLGLGAVLFFAALVAISNNVALRRLGVARWKMVQRSTYVVIAAVILHGAIYQIIEKRRWFLAVVFSLVACTALAFQLAGVRIRRHR